MMECKIFRVMFSFIQNVEFIDFMRVFNLRLFWAFLLS